MWQKWHFWHFDIIESANNVNNATLCNYECSIDFQVKGMFA